MADVSRHAAELLRASDVVDLHVDSFIATRLFGYDLNRRHARPGPLRGLFLGHLDFPRAIEDGLTGAMWSITTNPFRRAAARWRVFLRNVDRLRAQLDASGGRVRLARTFAEYRAARVAGAHACLPAIQGGNALAAAPAGCASIPENFVTRVTLVHLTSSLYGATSSPLALGGRNAPLGEAGRALVAELDRHRVFVDLAHIGERGFFDAVAAHDRSLPLLVTHTGVSGVRPHWRNLSDAQIRAIAETGGTVGIIFHQGFLAAPGGPRDGRMVVDHMEHVIRVAGEDFVSIGSDYDGMITPPEGLRAAPGYAQLAQWMLDRGWSDARVAKILGGNFLRCFAALRP
ncbi:MAG: membrane dipeptidase [Myxococcota bacterium]